MSECICATPQCPSGPIHCDKHGDRQKAEDVMMTHWHHIGLFMPEKNKTRHGDRDFND